MLTRIRIAAAALALCAACSTASADTKSHRKAAEDLLKVMGTETQLQKSLDQVLEIQAKSNPQLAPFKDVMKTFFAKYLSWEGLKEDLIDIYAPFIKRRPDEPDKYQFDRSDADETPPPGK